ncbi:MAG: hypothetical protein GY856_40680 [bacterium]|nr:hypothetical protein [bacterium]
MIKKLIRIDAPLRLVKDMFCDTDAWPQWMPGVNSCRTLREGDDCRVIEVHLSMQGKSFLQTREVRFAGNRVKQRQVAGWFRSWESEFSFHQPPDGKGTTISLRIDFDLGVRGLIIPRWVIQRMSVRLLDETTARAKARARELMAKPRPEAAAEGESLLQIYETPDGLELWFAGRTYTLTAVD